MDHKRRIKATLSDGYANFAGLIVLSLGLTLALIPLAIAGVLGTPLVVFAGLWTSCLLLGISIVVTFRFTVTVAARGVSVDLWSTTVPALRNPIPGLTLGVATFGVFLTTGIVFLFTPATYRPFAVGVAAFLLVLWYLLTAFATPELGTGQGVAPAVRASGVRLVESPELAIVFLVLTVVCTLVAGMTVVTMGLLLPGVLALLAAELVTSANGETDR
jgi:hypothetical protein